MTTDANDFSLYIGGLPVDRLRPFSRLWGAPDNARKADCLRTVLEGLASPERVRAVIAKLEPPERMALALLKWLGNNVPPALLAVALLAAGRVPRDARRLDDDLGELWGVDTRGLFLGRGGYWRDAVDTLGNSGRPDAVFTDDRILEQVGPAEPKPIRLRPVPRPDVVLSRRPQAVFLDVLSILQAVEKLGGLGLTKSGWLRVSDRRKLLRALSWGEETSFDGLVFPDPALAFESALSSAGLLEVVDDRLVVAAAEPVTAPAQMLLQVRALLHGFLRACDWRERRARGHYHDIDFRLSQARVALVVALGALADGAEAFYAIDDLDRELFARLGERFSLTSFPFRPGGLREDVDRAALAKWREGLRALWLSEERPWLDAALTTWLYALGIVELGMVDGRPVSFRLTELGHAILHETPMPSAAEATPTTEAAWVVQPNFDIVLWLERATAAELAFLERHAQRAELRDHTAHYVLTRDAVYTALEGGSTVEGLLDGLQAGSQAELPQNVVAEVREWARMRERITVYRSANLLEFTTPSARDAALAEGLAGTPVAERYVLLRGADGVPQRPPWSPGGVRRLDYSVPLPPCVYASADGVVRLATPATDIITSAQLDRWCRRLSARRWVLTAETVAAAAKAGHSARAFAKLLDRRAIGGLPDLVTVALRSWAGKPAAVAGVRVVLMVCPTFDEFVAIRNDKRIGPRVIADLAPQAMLLPADVFDEVHARLEWAGVKVAMSDGLVPDGSQ